MHFIVFLVLFARLFFGYQAKEIYLKDCDSDGFACIDEEQAVYDCGFDPLAEPVVGNKDENKTDTLYLWSTGPYNTYYNYNNRWRNNYHNNYSNNYNNESSNTNETSNAYNGTLLYDIKNFTIVNCDSIVLDLTKNYWAKRNITQINIVNVNNVLIQGKDWPLTVVIENSRISTFPRDSHFNSITLRNVTVNGFGSNVYYYRPAYGYSVTNVTIIKSRFTVVPAYGFTVTGGFLIFEDNTVLRLSQSGMNVTACNVVISRNYFRHVDIGAFNNINPEINWDSSSITVEDNVIGTVPDNRFGYFGSQGLKEFENIKVNNNIINGTTRNIQWFYSNRSRPNGIDDEGEVEVVFVKKVKN